MSKRRKVDMSGQYVKSSNGVDIFDFDRLTNTFMRTLDIAKRRMDENDKQQLMTIIEQINNNYSSCENIRGCCLTSTCNKTRSPFFSNMYDLLKMMINSYYNRTLYQNVPQNEIAQVAYDANSSSTSLALSLPSAPAPFPSAAPSPFAPAPSPFAPAPSPFAPPSPPSVASSSPASSSAPSSPSTSVSSQIDYLSSYFGDGDFVVFNESHGTFMARATPIEDYKYDGNKFELDVDRLENKTILQKTISTLLGFSSNKKEDKYEEDEDEYEEEDFVLKNDVIRISASILGCPIMCDDDIDKEYLKNALCFLSNNDLTLQEFIEQLKNTYIQSCNPDDDVSIAQLHNFALSPSTSVDMFRTIFYEKGRDANNIPNKIFESDSHEKRDSVITNCYLIKDISIELPPDVIIYILNNWGPVFQYLLNEGKRGGRKGVQDYEVDIPHISLIRQEGNVVGITLHLNKYDELFSNIYFVIYVATKYGFKPDVFLEVRDNLLFYKNVDPFIKLAKSTEITTGPTSVANCDITNVAIKNRAMLGYVEYKYLIQFCEKARRFIMVDISCGVLHVKNMMCLSILLNCLNKPEEATSRVRKFQKFMMSERHAGGVKTRKRKFKKLRHKNKTKKSHKRRKNKISRVLKKKKMNK